ncbi:MAG: PspC domain-containing protein [Bacteroidales bacterium]|uniref:PspC domain-containing protein n=1 Tax=Porphyromonas sp. TaxID=1924944 RepID=UPI002979EB47|nr:PspC domain-containing protein [Porphyromonas sp.]MDD7438527.1 PspC domain-containing protein [Bacteroidales bacterium]MDY3067555.1 PspC domain-containing protein [Porphyromonas sp.]
MKKTISVNLANRNFYIEEDAFNVLDQYIKGIREYYKADDPEGEIAEDFEMRMGELFQEKMRLGHEVITLEITKEVIKQMGRIEDLDESEVSAEEPKSEKASSERSNWTQATENFSQKLEKKLYRDPKNKWLGGVIAGLAVNFNTEVALLRLIAVLLLFTPLTWLVMILYLAGWIFLPAAETASDRLKMEGKPLNSENLWHTISKETPEMNKKSEKVVEESPKTKKSNAIWWVVAVLLVLGIIGMIAWAITSFNGGFVVDPDYWLEGEFFNQDGWSIFLALVIALFVILFAILLVIGIIALIYIVPIGLILRSNSLNAVAKLLLVILWLFLTGGWFILANIM